MQPVEALGREAVRLLRQWNQEHRAPEPLTVPLRFCDRGSVLPAVNGKLTAIGETGKPSGV